MLIVSFFIAPYTYMLITSFKPPGRGGTEGLTVVNYVKGLTDRYYTRVLLFTLALGAITTISTLLLGYPLAYHLAQRETKYKAMLFIMVLSPLLTDVVIRCYGWMLLLGDRGLINNALNDMGLVKKSLPLMYNVGGVYVGLVHVYLPFMVLSLIGSIQGIDPSLREAARSLGASHVKAFFRITLPLSLPGIASGCVLVFLLSVSSYVIPILLGGNKVMITPVLVIQTVLEALNWPFGAALAFILFSCAVIIVSLLFLVLDKLTKGVSARERS
jgi:putative spermidine/putrescine transport system permease protein